MMEKKSLTNVKFSALYYPYSRFLYQTDLKRAALIFDEILFVDPLSGDIVDPGGQRMMINPQLAMRGQLDIPNWAQVRRGARFLEDDEEDVSRKEPELYDNVNAYKSLKENNIAHLVTPQDHLKQHQNILTYSILRDFCHGLTSARNWREKKDWWTREEVGWKLHTSRIPTTLSKLRSDKNLLKECIKLTGKQTDKDDSVDRLKILERTLVLVDQALQSSNDDVVILPFDIAYVLIINQALLMSEVLQAFPVTDDPLAHDGLLTKFSEMYNIPDKEIQSVIPRPTSPDLYRIQSFTLSVVSQLIPDELLDHLSMEQIITFRKHNSDPLHRFHEKMMEISSEISEKPWEQDYQSKVLRMIDNKVIPEVRNLDDELKNSYQDLFGSVIGKVGSDIIKVVAPTIPSITMATFLGLSTGQTVLLGAASLMSGLGIALPDLVQYWQSKSEHRRNGLAYLLNFRREFTRFMY